MSVVRLFSSAVVTALLLPALAASSDKPALGRDADEMFLRAAEVVSMKPIGTGITKPMKVTLRDGGTTRHAVWKTVNDMKQGVFKGDNGGFQQGFRDSYKNEVAAYEMDKLLDLGLVPPTVEREIDGKRGSLQLWIEESFTELDRLENAILPDDYLSWTYQMHDLRLLNQLIYNSDTDNARNLLYDESLKVYAIDNSRSFLRFPYLEDEEGLKRFSRAVLKRLRALDRADLEAALGEWIPDDEIKAVLARRDQILEAASTRTALHGEETVLFP